MNERLIVLVLFIFIFIIMDINVDFCLIINVLMLSINRYL